MHVCHCVNEWSVRVHIWEGVWGKAIPKVLSPHPAQASLGKCGKNTSVIAPHLLLLLLYSLSIMDVGQDPFALPCHRLGWGC